MELLQAIMTRRSIRKFTDQIINDIQIETMLRAAMQAPSAKNTQPWHFIVIKDRQMLNKIPEFHPYSRMLLSASCAILVCADESLQSNHGYFTQDCGAATQNLLLAAHDLGFGAVWLGIYPRPERMNGMIELCGIPQGIVPFVLIAIGYPDESKPSEDRFRKDRIRINRW